MAAPRANPIVHIELHTGDLEGASSFYTELFRWRAERIEAGGCGSYLALEPGGEVGGGVVECGADRALWLPYVKVTDVEETTTRAREMGASVLLEPRGGPTGQRSVLATPAAGEVALWQPRS